MAATLAKQALAGQPASDADLNAAAKSLDVDVGDLKQAMTAALNLGTATAEAAGTNSAPLREHSSGGHRYANQAEVDINASGVLGGHNLSVDATAAASVGAESLNAQSARAVAEVAAKAELKAVPTVADLEAVKVGGASAADVSAALKKALLSTNPVVVKKAANTLRTAEAYTRKAAEDQENYRGTGFYAMTFPPLKIELNAAETKAVVRNIGISRDPQTAGSMMLASQTGLVTTTPAHTLTDHQAMREMWPAGKSALLPGSNGAEKPSGRDSFQEEWTKDAEPGIANIDTAIRQTAKANGATCPFAQGNHAKGQAFGEGEFQVNKNAPQWARELIGDDAKQGVMMRISTSHSNPNDHDREGAMTGVRLVVPIRGAPGDDGSQIMDITANNGETTHAANAREHTAFTNNISVPKDGLAGTKPVRVLKHLAGGVLNGTLGDRVSGIRNALSVTKEAMAQPFDEQDLYARHTLFVGGRYVQIRYKVVDPQDFKTADPDAKNGQTDAKADGIRRAGLKMNVYMKELPEGNPDLVEQEGWHGGNEVLLGTASFKPQESDPDSAASQYFDKYAHVPGRQNMLFRGVGVIGRHRSPVYQQSENTRHEKR